MEKERNLNTPDNSQLPSEIWSSNDVHKLITLVRNQGAIYDGSLPDHSNRDLIEMLWGTIGKRLNRSADTCSKKWQILRAGYRKRRHDKRLYTGSRSKKLRKWPYFDELKFLEEFVNERRGAKLETGAKSSYNDDFFEFEPIMDGDDAEVTDIYIDSKLRTEKKSDNKDLEEEFSEYLKSTTEQPVEETNSNKLFLLSLLEDMSALSKNAQFDFKLKTLTLLNDLRKSDN